MKESIFLVEENLDGGFGAKVIDYPIFTQGDALY